MNKNQKTKRIGVRIGVAIVALVAVAAVSTGGAVAADPADVNEYTYNATDKDLSGPLPPEYKLRGTIVLANETMEGTLDKSEVSFNADGVPITVDNTGIQTVTAYINETDIPDGGLEVEYSISGSSGTTIRNTTIYKDVYDTDSASISESVLKNAQSISWKIDQSEVEISDFSIDSTPNGPTMVFRIHDGVGGFIVTPPLDGNDVTTVGYNQTEYNNLEGSGAWDDTFDVNEDKTLYFPKSVKEIQIDGSNVYDADAPDPADITIEAEQNATDKDLSGPLPQEYEYRGLIGVANTTPGATLDKSEVSFDTNGVPINVTDPDPQALVGYINESDIPDGGITVDVSVSGTTIGSRTIYKDVYDTDSTTINKSTINNAGNITLKINQSEVGLSNYRTSTPFANDEVIVDFVDDSGSMFIESTPVNSSSSNVSNVKWNQTIYDNVFGPGSWDNTFDVDQDKSLYFHQSVEKIQIDGESVYGSDADSDDDAPLGGGGGDGDDDQTLLIVLSAAAAAVLLLRWK